MVEFEADLCNASEIEVDFSSRDASPFPLISTSEVFCHICADYPYCWNEIRSFILQFVSFMVGLEKKFSGLIYQRKYSNIYMLFTLFPLLKALTQLFVKLFGGGGIPLIKYASIALVISPFKRYEVCPSPALVNNTTLLICSIKLFAQTYESEGSCWAFIVRIGTVLFTLRVRGGFVTGIGQPAQLVWTLYVWEAPLEELGISHCSCLTSDKLTVR
jgi:hypothetical protein